MCPWIDSYSYSICIFSSLHRYNVISLLVTPLGLFLSLKQLFPEIEYDSINTAVLASASRFAVSCHEPDSIHLLQLSFRLFCALCNNKLDHSQGWFSWASPPMHALDSPPLSVAWKGQTRASWCWGSSFHASLKCSDQTVLIMRLVEACESLVARGGGRAVSLELIQCMGQ